MADIVAFIRAQLDEDEATALAIAARVAASPGSFVTLGLAHPELAMGDCPSDLGEYDPARVLAEVAAKRAILERHDAGMSRVVPGVRLCPSCAAGQSEHFTEHGCLTLRLLAQPYEGADGWDPAWKVTVT